MRIQLVSKDNGYGLTRDVEVMRAVLEPHGHDVVFTDWRTPRRVSDKHFHVNFFLELVNPWFFRQATKNYFVCNPEWMLGDWEKHLPSFDLILAKTRDCERIFTAKGLPTRYIGFTSPDYYEGCAEDLPHWPMVVHFVGHSVAKGTAAVIEAARQLPQVHFAVIGKNAPADVPANVGVIREPTDREFIAYKHAPIHCQPSSYEGFGHCINEARALKALVITTAAEPMSELITEEFGFGAAHCEEHTERLARHKSVCVDSLVDMIQAAVDCINTSVAGELGDKARAAYLRDREEFTRNITDLLAA